MRRPSKSGDSPTCAMGASDAMLAKPDAFTFAAIGDLHVREDRGPLLRELFAEISAKAEVLVLCGDLTDVGKPREAEVLAEDLRDRKSTRLNSSHLGIS